MKRSAEPQADVAHGLNVNLHVSKGRRQCLQRLLVVMQTRAPGRSERCPETLQVLAEDKLLGVLHLFRELMSSCFQALRRWRSRSPHEVAPPRAAPRSPRRRALAADSRWARCAPDPSPDSYPQSTMMSTPSLRRAWHRLRNRSNEGLKTRQAPHDLHLAHHILHHVEAFLCHRSQAEQVCDGQYLCF